MSDILPAYDRLLENQNQSAILLDNTLTVHHIMGGAHRWMQVSGRPTSQLRSMLAPSHKGLAYLATEFFENKGAGSMEKELDDRRFVIESMGEGYALLRSSPELDERDPRGPVYLKIFRYARDVGVCTLSGDHLLTGQELVTMIHPHDRQQFQAELSKPPVPLGGADFIVRKRESEAWRWTQVCLRYGPPLHNNQPSWVVQLADVHELKSKLDSLQSRTGAPQGGGNDEQLNHFAHMAAHDLKAPIRAVLGFTAAAMGDLGDDHPTSKHLERVQRAGRRMSGLVSALVEYAKAGAIVVNTQPTDLKALLERVKQDLSQEIAGSKATIHIGPMPPINADPEILQDVLHRLVHNAIKFTDEAPQVNITAEEGENHLTLHIDDNGVGIPEEQLRTIFDPFHRVHSTKRFPGTGVGLAICRRLVAQHRGLLWGASNEFGGSRFSVRIPHKQ